MRSSILPLSSIPLLLLLSSPLPGCGPAETGSGSADLTVAPTPVDVATCRSKTFSATPSDDVTWSLEGEGTLKDGDYQAPITVPNPATATIDAKRGEQAASATVSLATAFPEAAIDAARATSQSAADHVHGAAARGDRAYALLEARTDNGVTLGVARSDDGGLTWKAPVTLPAGDRIPAVAIDAGDPDTLYVTVHGKNESAGSTLDLAVSTDGGQTFSTHRLFVGGNGEAEDADVVSPAAGVVVVTAPATWQDGNGGQGDTLLLWRDAAKGAGFGALVDLDNGYGAQWSPGAEQRLASGRLIETNDSRGGPEFATNGKGAVCLVTNDYDINGADEHHAVQCSSDAGASFGAPVVVASGLPAQMNRSRVAVSADGQAVAVAYNAFADGNDTIGQTRYLVSTDGGATFGAEHTHPDALAEGGQKLGVSDVEVFFDSANVLWFARTVDHASLSLDKSCDLGSTLSGAFSLPISGNHTNAVLFESSAGLFGGGVRIGATDVGLTFTRLLAP